MALCGYYVCAVTAVPGLSALAAIFCFSFFFFFLQMQPDVTRRFTPHTVSGVCSLAPAPEVQGCLQNGK